MRERVFMTKMRPLFLVDEEQNRKSVAGKEIGLTVVLARD